MDTRPYAIILIIIVLTNLILYPFGLVPHLIFWSVIAISAILAWKVLPWMKEEL